MVAEVHRPAACFRSTRHHQEDIRTEQGMTGFGQHSGMDAGRREDMSRLDCSPRSCLAVVKDNPSVANILQDHGVEKQLGKSADLHVGGCLEFEQPERPVLADTDQVDGALPPVKIAPPVLGGPS